MKKMSNGYKLGLAAIAVSISLVGCSSDTTTATTDTATTATTDSATDTATDAITLEEFVSGKKLTVSTGQESAEAIFASDGYYEENHDDGGFCNGTWEWIENSALINTTCSDEGVVPSDDDVSQWEFVGELKKGMTVIIDNPSEGTMEVTITKIETAVNPDA